jgi:hypothetical protein
MAKGIEHRARADRDRYAALLRDCMKALAPERMAEILSDIEAEFHSPDIDAGERFELNAMLVGFMTVMLESIDVEQRAPRDERPHG